MENLSKVSIQCGLKTPIEYVLENSQLSAFRVVKKLYEDYTIEALNIPSNVGGIPVTAIEDNAFNEISSLEYISIPNTVTRMGTRAFLGCTNLKEIKIPGSVKKIPFSFQSCDNLKIVEFEDGVESIEAGAFSDCENIKQIYFPKSIKFIDKDAFKNSSNINLIVTNGNIEAIRFARVHNFNYI